MHFLKCNSCGHFNEIKSEYLVFCTKCNKKLDNNYPDWSKRNSDKSFYDYKQMICTTKIDNLTTDKPKAKKTKGLKYWIGFVVFFAIFYAVGQFGGEKLVSLFKKPAIDKAMMEMASEINKSCPFMVDNLTRLDNAVAMPNNVFQYNYTLINIVKDSLDINELKNNIEPTIINFVKTNPDMKAMRDNKTTVNYYYKDMTGVFLLTISVGPDKY